ncbi:hypothetical protein F5Y16DRAFT_424985 [Xylariaceae sp. FL0255]|nr:hypothetical protein F5Y16DRAFT_424985 [Xylariaceae sp. FL0255]
MGAGTLRGRYKRTQRLIKRLKLGQEDDVPVPNPTIPELKSYLRYNPLITHVFIKLTQEDDVSAFRRAFPPISSDRIPRFIASQLASQRINANAVQHVLQVSALLAIVSEYLARDPTDKSYPTLFIWTSPDGHRSYCVFTHLTLKMESRSYSVSELIKLRGTQDAQNLLSKLKSDPEIGEVLAKEKGNTPQPQLRASKNLKPVSSSSNESDNKVVTQSKEELQLCDGEVQWKYRGRTGSEVNSTEPLSAPTGLEMQQSEGFQRFFKAVVSPTHVRVTAGGRIVPNTRGSLSPTTKWDKEKVTGETKEQAESTEGSAVPVTSANDNQTLQPGMVPPMMPAQAIAPVAYQQHMGVPMPLYARVPQGFAYPYSYVPITAPFTNFQHPALPNGQQNLEAVGTGATAGQPGENNSSNRPQQPLMISPPEHFDQSRPFYVNGQLVFPALGMGQPQMPHIPFFANSGFHPGTMVNPSNLIARPTAMSLPVPNPAPVAKSAGPSSLLDQGPPNTNLNQKQWVPSPAPSALTNQPPAPPLFPNTTVAPSLEEASPGQPPIGAAAPISSIRPSEITRKQLEGLRREMKYAYAQLEYNRHQIDESYVFHQANRLHQQIAQFEKTMQAQLKYEREHYPDMEPPPKHIIDKVLTPSRPPSVRQTHGSGSSYHGSARSNGPVVAQQNAPVGVAAHNAMYNKPVDRSRARQYPKRSSRNDINSNVANNSTAHIDAYAAAVMKKLAAPDATPEQKAAFEHISRTLPILRAELSESMRNSSESNSSIHQSTQGAVLSSIREGSSSHKIQGQGETQSSTSNSQNQRDSGETSGETTRSAGAYFTADTTPYLTPVSGNGINGPYLVGAYPNGTSPWTYKGPEFVYARELTDDEKKARHVYWQQVPSKGLGLPKFDGKDFWPASPKKQADPRLQTIISGRAEIDYNFDVKRPEADPFRSSRDADSIRSYDSGRRLSKAIPIVAPPDSGKEANKRDKTDQKARSSEVPDDVDNLAGSIRDWKLSSPENASQEHHENANEVFSAKSGSDLWQTMLKKGSTSGNVLPGAVSSTTAKGYLPQYSGNAIASLGPTISNGSPARGSPNPDDNKQCDSDRLTPPTTKMRENCPPSSAPSIEHDVTKDLHDRMLRDAERRGVIGSDWQ